MELIVVVKFNRVNLVNLPPPAPFIPANENPEDIIFIGIGIKRGQIYDTNNPPDQLEKNEEWRMGT